MLQLLNIWINLPKYDPMVFTTLRKMLGDTSRSKYMLWLKIGPSISSMKHMVDILKKKLTASRCLVKHLLTFCITAHPPVFPRCFQTLPYLWEVFFLLSLDVSNISIRPYIV